MEATTRTSGTVTIVDLTGRMVAGSEAMAFRNHVAVLYSQGKSHVLLNMAGIRMMDSSGLGELTAAKRQVEAAGGALKLLNVGAGLQMVLGAAGLSGAFEMFNNETAAVASYRR